MIIRVHKQSRFTTIDNAFLNDKTLSFRAKGLFAFMLSRPDDWKFNEKHLSSVSVEKKSAVSNSIKELQNSGYLHRHAKRDDKGRMIGYEYDLYESKEMANKGCKQIESTELPITQLSDNGQTDNGKPDDGKSAPTKDLSILNTDTTKPIPESSDFTSFKSSFTDMLNRNGIDTKLYGWSLFSKTLKQLLKDCTIDRLNEALKKFEHDKWAIENAFSFHIFKANLTKYLMLKQEQSSINILEEQTKRRHAEYLSKQGKV